MQGLEGVKERPRSPMVFRIIFFHAFSIRVAPEVAEEACVPLSATASSSGRLSSLPD